MRNYQRAFIQFALDQNILRFGHFTLKSGRTSPYFFNMGSICTGSALRRMGEFYADALLASGMSFDLLLGPAYKGIPLVTATAMVLAERGHDLPWCFNRKESKTHGEGGLWVGAPVSGRIMLVDDVITAGTAIRDVLQMIPAGAEVIGTLVAINRQERGQGAHSAIQEVERDHGLQVASIVNLDHVIEYLASIPELQIHLPAMEAYRSEYGV